MARRPSRADDMRDQETREVLQNLSADPFHVPHHEIPDDMEYRWVNEEVLGWQNTGNVTARARAGWKAVPAERHPTAGDSASIFRSDPDREKSNINGVIRYRGNVLCERPKRIGAAIRAALEAENQEILMSTPGMESLNTGYVRVNKTDRTVGFAE